MYTRGYGIYVHSLRVTVLVMNARQLLGMSGGILLLVPQLVAAKTPSITSELLLAAAAATSTLQESATPGTMASPTITRGDVVALTQPAIVRILTHYEGTTTIPNFQVNLETLTWSIGSAAPRKVPYSDDFTGSGFIVSSDGYIITNSHVASGVSLQEMIAVKIPAGIILKKAANLTAAQEKHLTDLGYTSDDFAKLTASGVTFIMENLEPVAPTSITVLTAQARPSATSTSAFTSTIQNGTDEEIEKQIKEIISTGVPAKLVYENRKFIDDEKDIAVLKVTESGLPTLRLGDSTAVTNGEPIYVFGFPATADISGLVGEPSFTPGAVSAFKDSTQHTFKYIQTDAKVSHGSSGGPVLNAQGEAIGVITLASSNEEGDSFAFALPIDMVQNVITGNSLTLSTDGGYTSHMLAGLAQKEEKHCKAANEEFTAALAANSIFSPVSTFVQPYIDSCNALIASGDSIDSSWDAIRAWIKGKGMLFWMLFVGGFVALIVVILVIMMLVRRMRKDESALAAVSPAASRVAPTTSVTDTPPVGLPPLTPVSPSVLSREPDAQERAASRISQIEPSTSYAQSSPVTSYIAEARASGETDEEIRANLLKAGWDSVTIDKGLLR